MTYVLNVAPDARAAINGLDIEAQEAVFDLLDELAKEGSQLDQGKQRHLVLVSTPALLTYASVRLFVDHKRRELRLASVRAWVV